MLCRNALTGVSISKKHRMSPVNDSKSGDVDGIDFCGKAPNDDDGYDDDDDGYDDDDDDDDDG